MYVKCSAYLELKLLTKSDMEKVDMRVTSVLCNRKAFRFWTRAENMKWNKELVERNEGRRWMSPSSKRIIRLVMLLCLKLMTVWVAKFGHNLSMLNWTELFLYAAINWCWKLAQKQKAVHRVELIDCLEVFIVGDDASCRVAGFAGDLNPFWSVAILTLGGCNPASLLPSHNLWTASASHHLQRTSTYVWGRKPR